MKWIFRKIIGAIMICLVAFGIAWIVMTLWNYVMPSLFGLHMIDYWHAFALLILAKLLFGGFRGRRCCHGGGRRAYWRKRWQEKMEDMTPEEKEKVMRGLRKCHWWEPDWENKSASPGEGTTPGNTP